jgi:hypothetical protein
MIFHHELLEFHKLKQISSDAGRKYETPTGERYPSVTTVIGAMSDKSGLGEWRKRVGYAESIKIGQQAAKRGSAMHKMCEEYLANLAVEKDEHMLGLNREMFESIRPLLDAHVTKVHGIEFPVYSHKLKTAGTVDFFCEWDGKKTILDFKTSSRAKAESWIEGYFIQATIYVMCLWEIYGIKVEQIAVLIAVEHDRPQLFVKDPMDYMPRALHMFKEYHAGRRVNG